MNEPQNAPIDPQVAAASTDHTVGPADPAPQLEGEEVKPELPEEGELDGSSPNAPTEEDGPQPEGPEDIQWDPPEENANG